MKGTDNSCFHFVYILAALTTTPGGLKRYFFAYVDHVACCWILVTGCWALVAGKVSGKGNIVTGLKLPLQETSNQ